MSIAIIVGSIVLGVVVALTEMTHGAILVTIPFLALGYFLGKRNRK